MVGKLALLAVFTASQAFAAPVSLDSACGLDDFSLELPQSVIDDGMQVPEGAPKFVALGRGVQVMLGSNETLATADPMVCRIILASMVLLMSIRLWRPSSMPLAVRRRFLLIYRMLTPKPLLL